MTAELEGKIHLQLFKTVFRTTQTEDDDDISLFAINHLLRVRR